MQRPDEGEVREMLSAAAWIGVIFGGLGGVLAWNAVFGIVIGLWAAVVLIFAWYLSLRED